jgi:hypothetical protein
MPQRKTKGGAVEEFEFGVLNAQLESFKKNGQPINYSLIARRMRRTQKTIRSMIARRGIGGKPIKKGAARKTRALSAKTSAGGHQRAEIKAILGLLNKRHASGEKLHGTHALLQKALFQQHKIKLSVPQIKRRCKAAGVRAKVRPQVPKIGALYHAKVRKWSRATLDKIKRCKKGGVKRYLFCDEWPGDDGDHGERTELCAPGQSPAPRERRNRFPSLQLQAWCLIGIGLKKIIFLDSRQQRFNSASYRKLVLTPCLPLFKGKVLYQDGARCHWGNVSAQTTAKTGEKRMKTSNRVWLQNKGVEVLEPVGNTPFLNPIENVFSLAVRNLSAMRHTINTQADLKRCMKQAFDAVPQRTINHMIRNYPQRLKRAITDPQAASVRPGDPQRKSTT